MIFKNELLRKTLYKTVQSLQEYTPSKKRVEKDTRQNFLVEKQHLKMDENETSGVIWYGNNGSYSSIFDEDGNHKANKEAADFEYIPYFFYLSAPNVDRAPILCLQQLAGRGVYPFFVYDFYEEVRKEVSDEDIIFSMSLIQVGGLYLPKYIKDGVVKSISASEYRAKSEIAGENKEVRQKHELVLSSVDRKKRLGPLNDILGKSSIQITEKKVVFQRIRELYAIDVEFEDLDELTIVAELGGVERAIKIGQNFGQSFDISNQVKRTPDGHPEIKSIREYTSDFIDSSIRPYIGGN